MRQSVIFLANLQGRCDRSERFDRWEQFDRWIESTGSIGLEQYDVNR